MGKTRLPNFPGVVLQDTGTYTRYTKVQTVANKLKHDKVFAKYQNIEFLVDRFRPSRVLCHGVRNGAEVKYFMQAMAKATYIWGGCIVGTDIAPVDEGPLSATPHVTARLIQADMHAPIPESPFDLVYSNSWDHSYDPVNMFRVWGEQVAPRGHMVLEHTTLHNPENTSERDPFGATIDGLKQVVRCSLGSTWKMWVIDHLPNMHHDLQYLVATRR